MSENTPALHARLFLYNGYLALECLMDPESVNQEEVVTAGFGTVYLDTKYVAITQDAFNALSDGNFRGNDDLGLFDIFETNNGAFCLSHFGFGHQLFGLDGLRTEVSAQFKMPNSIEAFHSIIANDQLPAEAAKAIDDVMAG